MAQASASTGGGPRAARERAARPALWLHRARNPNSQERQTLTIIVKCTLVASISWYLAYDVMRAQTPAFAPFSAVLMVQITAYRSLLQALRYVAAVAVGVSLQGLFGALAGPTMVSFVLVALGAMTIGRWRRLGQQGPQVATAAFFAFSTYAMAASESQGLRELGQILVLVLIGCGVGIVINVLVLPPLRYRSAEFGIHTLGHSLADLAAEAGERLCDGVWDKEHTEYWRHRANRLAPLAEQARSSVSTAWESTLLHPRRLLDRRRGGPPGGAPFSAYRQLVDALERTTYQTASVMRSIDLWHQDAEGPAEHRFMRDYGDFLCRFAGIAEIYGRLDEDRLEEQLRELHTAGERAHEARERLAELAEGEAALPLSDPSRPFGILLAEAVRLLDEADHIHAVLARAGGHRDAEAA
ncbi:aromatic acid exporter family member 1 [Streptomyces sp. Amel2xB2]|uniref:FUSC family protein n=1 Tax=Streptomyces sp. Amel2xB2 TaxID=1305829 RepID=UPI000DBF4FCB|nr:aromatic acid exporter family protein [Streptomyces sp. Amel2xB2]RAJ62386.1 aromatic acid exporter family member 1 [Streptomyces sp. Amel2xB2]